jgi:tRNA 2-thiouridine synthesizing protein A
MYWPRGAPGEARRGRKPRTLARSGAMNEDELKKITADKVVDARGMACPGPLLEAKNAIASIPVGGIMEVLSSDEGTNNDIPLWANKMHYEHLGTVEDAGFWRLFVKKTK